MIALLLAVLPAFADVAPTPSPGGGCGCAQVGIADLGLLVAPLLAGVALRRRPGRRPIE